MFETPEALRAHSKTAWHIYNVRQLASGSTSLDELTFEALPRYVSSPLLVLYHLISLELTYWYVP
jgi:hypothetical protein